MLGVVLATLIFISTTAGRPPQRDDRNLKVLPKDISDAALDTIMDEYTAALGVKCAYCHAPSKTKPNELDYASDDKAAKRIAREMMIMTIAVNKQYFKDHTDGKGVLSDAVSCITCHNGQEYPAFKKD